MKKIMFYIPAIIFVIFYGAATIGNIGVVSPIVVAWLALFFVSGFLLNKNIFWGNLFGVLPAIHLIYIGTQETEQIINEILIGMVILIFYIICGYFVLKNNKKGKE